MSIARAAAADKINAIAVTASKLARKDTMDCGYNTGKVSTSWPKVQRAQRAKDL